MERAESRNSASSKAKSASAKPESKPMMAESQSPTTENLLTHFAFQQRMKMKKRVKTCETARRKHPNINTTDASQKLDSVVNILRMCYSSNKEDFEVN